MLDKVLDRIKKIIGIENFDDTKDTDDKLRNDITFKNIMILMTYVIKDHGKFHPQLFLEEALFHK